MKKVLIVTYYWVPSGGSGVQRWVKFTKYLRDFGWEPIIYTPENPEYPSFDESFYSDIPKDVQVIKKPIWEPYNLYRSITKRKNQPIAAGFISEDKKPGWKDKLSVWIRGNFLIPDPRVFWVRPSVQFLSDFIQQHPIDAIITTGPPHSMHLIGKGLNKNFPTIPWIADFRDPWTSIFFYKDLKVNPISDAIQHALERKVIRSADTVLVVSNGMKNEFVQHRPKRIEVISNGFDTADVQGKALKLDSKFSISHVGQITPKQNPEVLWKVLGELCTENTAFRSDLCIQLVGKVNYSVFESIEQNGLSDNLLKVPYLPHNEAIERQQTSQVLLLALVNEEGNKCILTGKLFEYLAANRPIIGFGPSDGDAAVILNNTKAGVMIDFDDETATKNLILEYYSSYKTENLSVQSNSVNQYSRKNLTAQLVDVMNSL